MAAARKKQPEAAPAAGVVNGVQHAASNGAAPGNGHALIDVDVIRKLIDAVDASSIRHTRDLARRYAHPHSRNRQRPRRRNW